MLQYLKDPKILIPVIVLVLATLIFIYSKSTGPKVAKTVAKTVELQQGANNMVLSDDKGNLSQIPFPKGIVVIWSGPQDKVPNGWALCDGKDGTPDLRGRFVIGINPDTNLNSSFTKYNTGDTGGLERVKLEISEMPNHSHDHNIWRAGDDDCGDGNVFDCGEGGGKSSVSISSTGGGNPHENRPPYYALAYIMKL